MCSTGGKQVTKQIKKNEKQIFQKKSDIIEPLTHTIPKKY